MTEAGGSYPPVSARSEGVPSSGLGVSLELARLVLAACLLAACSGEISAADHGANAQAPAAPGSSETRSGRSNGKDPTTSTPADGDPATPMGTGPGASDPADLSFTCDPSASPPVEGLRRLTMTQYRNTVSDIVDWTLADATES